ncbi:MAG TPA: hypothetical protein VHG32_00880, partial [Thermoanaerobaculia bacterium]|nr:hypothetical protein [Thermoanaerobaculia bacterium]
MSTIHTIRRWRALLPAVIAVSLCLVALPGTGQQPSTTGTGTQGSGGKPPAKAGAKGPAATPKGGAPASAGAATPAKPGATAGSPPAAGSAGSGGAPAAGAPSSKGSKTPPGGLPPGAPGPPAIGSPLPDTGNIDQILEGDEAVLEGNAFTYDPGNRRDPFKSL